MPQKTKEEKKEYKRLHYLKNKEKEKEKALSYYYINKEKSQENTKLWKLKNKEAILKYNTTGKGKIIKIISQWKSRGILCFDYNLLYDIFVKTTNCEFCNVELNTNTKTLKCLDHDHSITDKFNVRGVLCNSCNVKDVYSNSSSDSTSE